MYIGNLRRIFRRVLAYNRGSVSFLLYLICFSLLRNSHKNYVGYNVNEERVLTNFFEDLYWLSHMSLKLEIPRELLMKGIREGVVLLKLAKAHKRVVKYVYLDNGEVGAETSDIVLLVTYKYIDLDGSARIIDDRISFFQIKLDKGDQIFDVPLNQWYLMLKWPIFSYGNNVFDLCCCRAVPDACSFYLLLYRNKMFIDNTLSLPYKLNSISLSTIYLSRIVERRLSNISYSCLKRGRRISVKICGEGDLFLGMLWYLLLTHYGVYDRDGIRFMETLFPSLFNSDPPRSIDEKISEERVSVGIRIIVTLRSGE